MGKQQITPLVRYEHNAASGQVLYKRNNKNTEELPILFEPHDLIISSDAAYSPVVLGDNPAESIDLSIDPPRTPSSPDLLEQVCSCSACFTAGR